MSPSRRSFLISIPTAGFALPVARLQRGEAVPSTFPAQEPAMVREMVAVSHGKVARVRELLEGRPALANAAWDWGFGDWETALGAASHVGNPEIARVLLAAGARPSIFSAAMLDELEVVRAFAAARPGVQRTRGPHGITLLSHALAGDATEVVKYLKTIDGADVPYRNEPVSATDRAAIVGTYELGPAPADRLVAAENSRGALVLSRQGGIERNLFHVGSRVFHPAGAEAVRIRFAAGEPSLSVTIEDGPVVVSARRA